MAIIRWNPWNLSSLLEDDWDLPTLPGLSKLGQGLNIYETEDSIIAEAAVPGLSEDQIDVTVEDGVVRVTGQAADQKEEKTNRRYFMTSMATSFNYSFRLPESLIEDKEPKAEVHKGILTLIFKKAQKVAPKKVKVFAKKES